MSETDVVRREVPADLVETTPGALGLGHWLLASPVILFVAWLWEDIFAYYSPLPGLLDWLVGAVLFFALVVLPAGLLAHLLVTSLPRLFSHAGWDIQPLEAVSAAEQYTVRYRFQAQHRAGWSWSRLLMRAGQGWVYIEIAAIFVGFIIMIPLYFSAVDFGFGR